MTICIHRNLNALRNGRKVPLSEDGGHIWSLKGYKSPKTLGKLQGHHDPLTDGALTLFDVPVSVFVLRVAIIYPMTVLLET